MAFLSGLLLVVRLVVGGRRICLTINQTFLNCFYEISQEGSCQIYCATIYLLHWGPFRGRMVVTSTPPPHLSRDFATCKHFKLKQLMATTLPLWSSQWWSSPFKRPHSYHPPKLSAFNQWIHVTNRQLSIAQNMEGECVCEMFHVKEKDKTRITETGEERIPKTVGILVYLFLFI